MSISVRKLRAPIEFVDGRVRTMEQDSQEHTDQCVDGIIGTMLGARIEKPEFGIPDTRFAGGSGTSQAVAEAIQRWEPRASVTVDAVPELLRTRKDAFVVTSREASRG